jgi:hypothetical protein
VHAGAGGPGGTGNLAGLGSTPGRQSRPYVCSSSRVSPLRGWGGVRLSVQGLTPLAIDFRPFAPGAYAPGYWLSSLRDCGVGCAHAAEPQELAGAAGGHALAGSPHAHPTPRVVRACHPSWPRPTISGSRPIRPRPADPTPRVVRACHPSWPRPTISGSRPIQPRPGPPTPRERSGSPGAAPEGDVPHGSGASATKRSSNQAVPLRPRRRR